MGERILCLCLGECKTAPPILITHLVELVAPDLSAEPERVLAPRHGGVVEELERVVLILEWAVGAIPYRAVVTKADGRNAPSYRGTTLQSGDAELVHDVA